MKKIIVALMLGLFVTATLPLVADDMGAAAPAAAAKPAKKHKAKKHKAPKKHKKAAAEAAPAADGAAK